MSVLTRRDSRDGRFLVAVLALALLLRVAFVLLYPQVPPVIGDDRMYDQVGWSLATGGGFSGGFATEDRDRPGRPAPLDLPGSPEASIGPVYPAFLATVYWIFGHEFWAARIAQACLSCFSIVFLYRLAVDSVGRAAARISAVLVASYPALIFYSGMLLTETLALSFLVLLVWAVYRAVHTESSRWWVAAGSVAGITVLLRAEVIVLIPFLAGAGAWLAPSRVRLQQLAIFGLVTMLIVGVWTTRNYVTFERFILVSAHGGDTIWLSTMGWTEWNYDDPELIALTEGLDYLEQDRVLGQEGIRNIIADPLGYLGTSVARLPHFWITSHTSYFVGFTEPLGVYYTRGEFGRLAVKLLLLGINLTTVVLGAVGVFLTFRPRRPAWPAALALVPIAGIGAVHFFLFAAPRYQVPILPFVLMFAAVAVLRVRGWLPQESSRSIDCA